MKTSENISKIAPALLAAQKSITFAAKDSTNPHFKSKYADLPTVIDAVKIALNNEGIAFIQSGSPSEQGHLAMTTRLLHESGEWIEDTATLPLPKADPQGYGSASTYARRYGLAAICGLYQDDDDGHAAQKPDKPEPLSEAMITHYLEGIKASGNLEDLKKVFAKGFNYSKSHPAIAADIKTAYDAKKESFKSTKEKATA